MKVLIIGVNGFIGSNLTKRILSDTPWHVYGMDINNHYVQEMLDHKRFHFTEGDISINNEWIQYHIKKCDVILPLVAIAQPKLYVTSPLTVFELDFEENLKIVRWVHQYNRRLIFPSTSEVYGMCEDKAFNEETSNFTYGPINKTRWIYANSKQLMDRVIHAYGRDRGLRYTIIRPFNWIGPRLDTMESARYGNSRVLTQFITNLIDGKPIQLVDGGSQLRTFTDIEDGVQALLTILSSEKNSDKKIFNLGNPNNSISIARLAEMVRSIYAKVTNRPEHELPPIEQVSNEEYYGKKTGYQDINYRVPDITLARELLNWNPSVPLGRSIEESVTYFVSHCAELGICDKQQ